MYFWGDLWGFWECPGSASITETSWSLTCSVKRVVVGKSGRLGECRLLHGPEDNRFPEGAWREYRPENRAQPLLLACSRARGFPRLCAPSYLPRAPGQGGNPSLDSCARASIWRGTGESCLDSISSRPELVPLAALGEASCLLLCS